MAFHPDCHELVTASEDGTAVIWNAESGAPTDRVLRHRRPVQDVVYSEDGRFILTSSNDRTVRLWDAVSGFPVTPSFLNPWSIDFGTIDPLSSQIICQIEGGASTWVWRIQECDYSSDMVLAYGDLLSGNQLSEVSEVSEALEWWLEDRVDSADDFTVFRRDIVSWHRAQAFDALMSIWRFRGQFRWADFNRLERAEAFHLERLEALNVARSEYEILYSQYVRDEVRRKREALDAK